MRALNEREKKLLDAHFKEYDTIRAELRSIQETQRRMLTLMPLAGAAISLFFNSYQQIESFVKAPLLLAFAFLFLFLSIHYVGLGRAILRLSKYQIDYLTPAINSLISIPSNEAMLWEDYVRKFVRNKSAVELLGFSLIHISEFALIFFPSVICLVLSMWAVSENSLCGKNYCIYIETYYALWLSWLLGSLILGAYLAKTARESKQVEREDLLPSSTWSFHRPTQKVAPAGEIKRYEKNGDHP